MLKSTISEARISESILQYNCHLEAGYSKRFSCSNLLKIGHSCSYWSHYTWMRIFCFVHFANLFFHFRGGTSEPNCDELPGTEANGTRRSIEAPKRNSRHDEEKTWKGRFGGPYFTMAIPDQFYFAQYRILGFVRWPRPLVIIKWAHLGSGGV